MVCGFARTHLRKRGFTIVELLVAIAIIIVLLGVIIVVLNKVTKTAQRSSTQAMMLSVSTGIQQFQEDVGYLPPTLELNRSLFDPPDDPDDAAMMQNWYSYTSLPDYLVGYGEGFEDGYGYSDQGETPPSGIRDPGPDGVWNADFAPTGDGALGDRNPQGAGKRLGPYLELKDDRLLGSINSSGDVFLPGDSGYNANDPKVLLDYWGRPIRYYRQLYRQGALREPYRPYSAGERQPNLGDVFLLRPWEVPAGMELNASTNPDIFSDTDGDTTINRKLLSAEYALFSSGPDKALDPTVRRDEDEFNEDNLVELGP